MDYTARDMLKNEDTRTAVQALADEVRLGEIWRAILSGHGATADEASIALVDLLLTSDYFTTAPTEATGEQLQRREGRREVMARILYLSDLPSSRITKLRRDLLDELQKLNER